MNTTTERQMLVDLLKECRTLREHSHERNLLFPLCRSLIGVADRYRQDLGRLRGMLIGVVERRGLDAVALSLSHICDNRRIDLLEIEALLATLGVESFQTPSDLFDAANQRCIKRIHTSIPAWHQRIAQRLMPGYRRHGDRLVRPECVTVYVFNGSECSSTSDARRTKSCSE